MVAVVAGNGLGLFNTSLNILGAAGSFGQGNLGQAGGKAWVNASTGNLILRFTDEQLSGQGQDLFHTRTYNTLGALNDADGDGWRWDGERRLVLSGTALTAGSSLTRITGDGHETVYAWNGSRYQSSEGDGAHDFIQWDGQNNEWYWTDGTTRSVERYNGSSGLLTSMRDTQGTLITYGYHNGRLTSVSDSSGQALLMVYNEAGKLVRLDTRSSAGGPLTSQVYYEYDSLGRLTQVKTDLTPDDNSIADGQAYATIYTYDGNSFRIASVAQSDGTSASFTYELIGSEYRVKTVTDASGTTTFTYVPGQRYTKVSNGLNQEWVYTYDDKGQLTYVRSPAENGQSFYTSYQYDADGNLVRVTDDGGNAVSYFYDERGNRILERDPKGVTVARTFSASNQVLNEIHYSQAATWYASTSSWTEPPASSAQVTRYVYDYAERLRFVVSATGSVAEYRYNANGLRVREVVYGDSRYDLSGVAANATLAESTLASWAASRDQTRSQVVTLSYDYRGNLSQRAVHTTVSAAGEPLFDRTTSVTEYVYSQHGQLLQTIARHDTSRSVLSSAAYDGMGRMIAQMDASGTRTTVYDGQSRKIAVTTASGLVLTQSYDTQGRLLSVQESASGTLRSTSYAYDAAGRLTMRQDATGVRSYTFYDALGRVAAEVDGSGSLTRYSYNQKDQRISSLSYATQLDTRTWFSNGALAVTLAQVLPASTAADRLTRFNYDEAGRLLTSVDGAGTVTSYQYDGRGQLVHQQTGERVTRLFYDADGRQLGQLDAEGYLRENVYNAAGQVQQVIRYAVATNAAARASGSLADLRPAGASLSTWNFYDGAGRQIGSVDEQGFVSETVYDEYANTTSSIRYASVYTAALNAASSFTTVRDAVKNGARQVQVTAYDGQGRVLTRTAADGSVITYEYDTAGRLVRETSAAGTTEERSTRILYDAFGQTTGKLLGEASARITAGMTQTQIAAVYSQYGTTWSYDAAGRVASVTDALGNRTLSYYDSVGRLTRVINAVGEVSETKYSAFGDAIERTQLAGRLAPGSFANQSASTLDSLVAAIRNANNDSRTSSAYDTRGLLLTSIDAEGISTTNQYDQYGQLQRQIRVIAGSRTVTSAYGYNLRGERISQTRDVGGLNLIDTTVYDAFGRVIRSTDAAGATSTSEYLDGGRTLVLRDALNRSRRSEFDAFGRVLKEIDALGNATLYSYDDINRSIVVTQPDGVRVSTWKTRHGDTLKVVNGKGDVTQYEYNRDGQLTRTVDALGQAVVNRYDTVGRLSESVDARGVVTHLDYDAANRVIQRSVDPTGLNLRTTYVFDSAGRQVRVVENPGTSAVRTTEYRYDRNGQLLQSIVDPAGLQLSTRYSHDGLGNVVRVEQGSLALPVQRVSEYQFDNLGRREQERVDPQGLNLVTRYQYDSAGRVLRKTDANGATTDYVYDQAGQLRLTLDALGYFSERRYDLAGRVLEETRYASKYSGPRDQASLQRLLLNQLNNAGFVAGNNSTPDNWTLGAWQSSAQPGINPADVQALIPTDIPPWDNTVQLYQGGRSPNSSAYQELWQDVSGIQPGQRYAFSVYTAVQNTTASAIILWYDANNNYLGYSSGAAAASQNAGEAAGGNRLADYKRLVAQGEAPAGAVVARVSIRKDNTLEGAGLSRLLAVHPQFERLEAGSSTVSDWARPLALSADDRTTSYVYDAAGRQRFSVDALGYVSGRSYDAAGNLVEEVRYANKLQGARTPERLQSLLTNQLANVGFGKPASGDVPADWTLGAWQSTGQPTINPAGLQGMIPADLPAGDNTVELYQGARTPSGTAYQELWQDVSGIQAGQRYAFSVYTAAQNTTASAIILWYDANHNYLGSSAALAASQNAGEAAGGTRLADYKRLVAQGEAPPGAVIARVTIRKADTMEGAGLSRLLAVHPQFEALAAGATTASAWSRPLQTSAADRVTSHVYDALGRQRFSIDALGYVSERTYDAAGNILEETRYATPLQGSRDRASLLGLGINQLANVGFGKPASGDTPAGWALGAWQSSAQPAINPTGLQGMVPADLPAGDNTVELYQGARTPNGTAYQELWQDVSGIQAGQRYAFSVYTAAQNTTASAIILWYDANNNYLGSSAALAASQNAGETAGGTRLADYKRLVAQGEAPPGAVIARVTIRKSDTMQGAGLSRLLAVHPQFEALAANATTASNWSRSGLSKSAADRSVRYVYDAAGRQRFSVDALGYVSERRYDAAGSVIEETRYATALQGSLGRERLQGLMSSPPASSANDRTTGYVYDTVGRQRFSVDALGQVSERSYDALGNLVRETRYATALADSRLPYALKALDPAGAGDNGVASWIQSQVGSSANDRITQYAYDAVGQLQALTDPLGYTESYTYDGLGNRTSLTNKNGQTWNYRYDQLGQLLEEITPQVRVSDSNGTGRDVLLVTRNQYNAFGNITSRSEGRLRASLGADPALDDASQARTASYGYDGLGRQVLTSSPGWYNKATGQFQQASDGTANTHQVTTEVTYDGLGNAVRNRVRINNLGTAGDYVDSYKAYDLLGQVRYEVDALKGVTVHEYNGFGQETLTRRHAAALNAGVPANGYYSTADFTSTTLPRDSANDRTLSTSYDRLGRKTEVQQDIVSLYSFTGNVATSALKNVAPVKVYGYNGFGEVTRETLVARDFTGASVMSEIITVNYYDRAGQRVGTVDALGYYTRLEYTGSGKVGRQVEYATALSSWNEASIPTAQTSTRDRSVRFTYDKGDRLVQTTQENVTWWQQTFAQPNSARATMTQVTGDVAVSSSSYDGVGNVRTLTDAAGNVTTTEYNAVGQVQKVTEPARYSARAGSVNPFDNSVYAAPVVSYAVNAFGQVVYEQRSAGDGQAGATQVTRTVYDAAGHEVMEIDAMGSAQTYKVDMAGRRIEERREISTNLTGWRYNDHVIRRTFTYDALGQQLGISDWYTDGGVQKSTSNSVVYNRFGEVTAELLNGNNKSTYVYNQLGNAIQQTNAQGVTRVDYDLTGKASRSTQLGDLATSADDRITYLRNDLLGRVLEQHLPAFEANLAADTMNSVSVALATPIIRQTSDRWGNVLSRTDARGYVTTYSYDHNNQVLTETLPETDILRENGTSYRASLIHEKRYDVRGLLIEEADLISTGGGVLRSRQHVYNQAGQVVRDIDALGGSRYYSMDAHGNRVGTYDASQVAMFDEYDALGRHTAHGVVRNGQRVTLLTNQYDQAGRLYAEIDGTATVTETLSAKENTDRTSTESGVAGNTRFTVFDERGNIVQTRTESNIQKTFVFNQANRKVEEKDGLNKSLTWTYDESDYGRLRSHKDLENRNFSYVYNAFGQVVSENSDKSYVYYGNGLLKSVTTTAGKTYEIGDWNHRADEWRSVTTSSYQYDLAGNKVNEVLASRVTSTADNVNLLVFKQETRYRFDEQGRLASAHEIAGNMGLGAGVITYVGNDDDGYSATFHYGNNATADIKISYKFDEFGNRRQSLMNTTNQHGTPTVIDNRFKYDANDRALVVDGLVENGVVVAGVNKGYTISYDAAGRRSSAEKWNKTEGSQEKYELSTYTYNDLGQVTSRSTSVIARKSLASSAGAVQSISVAKVDLSNIYDERGRVVIQETYKEGVAQTYVKSVYRGDDQKISELSYTYSNSLRKLSQATYFGESNMHDAAGNQLRYRYVAYNTSGVETQWGDYKTLYIGFETYKASSLVSTTNLSGYTPGTTGYVYNDRGELQHLTTNGDVGGRRFAYNGEGQIVGRMEGVGNVQNYLYYQNAALGNSGNVSAASITSTFDAISADYPGHAPGSYQVNQGDTFQKIAENVWGDSNMWYLIADANGKDASDQLIAGTSLRIPNVVGSTHNDATTFKPYSAEEVIGSTITPPTPPKPKKKKCNAVASVVMVVVAVVVMVITAGSAAPLVAGATAMSGSAVAAVSYGIGAVAGSLASQAVGKAMGVVDQISWKQAAVAGLTAGVASWAAPALGAVESATGSTMLRYAAQGALVYGTNYVGSKIVGLDTSFSWKNMAASAVASAVAGKLYADDGFMGSVIRGQASAHTAAWMRDKWFGGGRPDYGQVAVDAFGNALADYMVGELKAQTRNKPQEKDQSQAKDKLDLLDLGVNEPGVGGGGNPFHNPDDPEQNKALAQLAFNGDALPISRSDVVEVVDPGLVAEFREKGWFDLTGKLTDKAFSEAGYVGSISEDPGYITNLSNILRSDASFGDKLSMAWGMTEYAYRGSDAAQGTMQIIGGGLEVAGAAGLTTTGLGWAMAVPIAMHGGDSIATGFSRVFNGGDGTTLTYKATYELTGSRLIAQGIDQGLPLLAGVASLGSGLSLAESNILNNTSYRALNVADGQAFDRGLGLTAKAPGGQWTAVDHVLNSGPGKGGAQMNSPWISTSRDLSVSLEGYSGGNGFVAVNLNRVPVASQVEVWRSEFRSNMYDVSMAYHRSIWAQEVSVYQSIPKKALYTPLTPMTQVRKTPILIQSLMTGGVGTFRSGGEN